MRLIVVMDDNSVHEAIETPKGLSDCAICSLSKWCSKNNKDFECGDMERSIKNMKDLTWRLIG